jgi:hypothetical protein
MDDGGNLDPTPGEADVNAPLTRAASSRLRAELVDRRLVLQRHFVMVQPGGHGRDAATAR